MPRKFAFRRIIYLDSERSILLFVGPSSWTPNEATADTASLRLRVSRIKTTGYASQNHRDAPILWNRENHFHELKNDDKLKMTAKRFISSTHHQSQMMQYRRNPAPPPPPHATRALASTLCASFKVTLATSPLIQFPLPSRSCRLERAQSDAI